MFFTSVLKAAYKDDGAESSLQYRRMQKGAEDTNLQATLQDLLP